MTDSERGGPTREMSVQGDIIGVAGGILSNGTRYITGHYMTIMANSKAHTLCILPLQQTDLSRLVI